MLFCVSKREYYYYKWSKNKFTYIYVYYDVVKNIEFNKKIFVYAKKNNTNTKSKFDIFRFL